MLEPLPLQRQPYTDFMSLDMTCPSITCRRTPRSARLSVFGNPGFGQRLHLTLDCDEGVSLDVFPLDFEPPLTGPNTALFADVRRKPVEQTIQCVSHPYGLDCPSVAINFVLWFVLPLIPVVTISKTFT